MLVRMAKKIHKRRLEATSYEKVKKVLIQVVLGVDLPEVWFKKLHYSLSSFVFLDVKKFGGFTRVEEYLKPFRFSYASGSEISSKKRFLLSLLSLDLPLRISEKLRISSFVRGLAFSEDKGVF